MTNQPENNLDNKLFLVGGLITLVLTFSTLLNLNNKNAYISLILFLPIPLYFISVGLKKIIIQTEKLFSNKLENNIFFDSFDFKEFFSQSEPTFLITLFLLTVSITILMYQTSINLIL
ncbi:hypothetical protein A2572_03820 [Candidatus Collierbacteria bacterium RIFOXYD1_FULL_40_9]|uniref:Uncharacterized protein n=1 Tax=Candidatus Collierbacteria bacterium RIFOXYD1_FULL_40_9 TaxID=1817731 RepID=A0A1F5FU51_9BACT|nr:MAG: hypothetical protein A2572_03820 [Candidatus Collierbacteria bacterium RIFOXYD1_FULL_40_9]